MDAGGKLSPLEEYELKLRQRKMQVVFATERCGCCILTHSTRGTRNRFLFLPLFPSFPGWDSAEEGHVGHRMGEYQQSFAAATAAATTASSTAATITTANWEEQETRFHGPSACRGKQHIQMGARCVVLSGFLKPFIHAQLLLLLFGACARAPLCSFR